MNEEVILAPEVWQAVMVAVSFEWVRVRRLLAALSLAALIALFLCDFLEVSRRWAVPAGLFVAVQLQKNHVI